MPYTNIIKQPNQGNKMSNQHVKLIQGRINQYELAQKNARDTTKLFNQGAIQGLKQALEIIEGR